MSRCFCWGTPLVLLVIGAGGSTAAPGAKTKSINRQIDLPPEALDAPLLPVPGLLRRRSAARQTPIAAKSSPGSCEIPMLPQQPDRLPFGPGERLDFDVRMFGMKTGGISLSMSGREKVDDKMTYAVRAIGRTEGAATVLGGVDVRMMTWLNPSTMTPVRMASRARQTSILKKTLLVREDAAFRQQGRIDSRLKWWREGKAYRSDGHRVTDDDTVDALALLYYARSRMFLEGSQFCFTVFHRRGLWRVDGKVGKAELTSTPWGSREALRIQATVRRMLRRGADKEATKVEVWVSDDAARLPLRIEKQERLGSIVAVLARYSPGRTLVRRRSSR